MRCRLLPMAAALAVAAAACGDDEEGSASTDDGATGTVTVFAAASLTDAFTELGDAFAAAEPGAAVTFSFAASSELVAQIAQGAPADVLASADQANMAKLVGASEDGSDPVVFATNAMEIAVEPGNPEGIAGLADLAGDDLIVVTCAVEVPCGTYAAEVLRNAGVSITPDSYEENVRAVVSKVALGEADAGIVYRTDVTAAGGDVDGVAIPDDVNIVAEYPIAVTAEARNPAGAQAFVDFVRSEQGRRILESHGFTTP